MLSNKEYQIFKYYLNKYQNQLSKEYIIDILLFLKPQNYKKTNIENQEKNDIGLVIVKIEKILSNIFKKNNYLKKETIKLFKLVWTNQ